MYFADSPGQPAIEAARQVVDVTETIQLNCFDGTDEYSSGNPPATQYYFKFSSTDICSDTGGDSECSFVVNSVNQVGPYTCLASNYPDIGQQYGPESTPIDIVILGSINYILSFDYSL